MAGKGKPQFKPDAINRRLQKGAGPTPKETQGGVVKGAANAKPQSTQGQAGVAKAMSAQAQTKPQQVPQAGKSPRNNGGRKNVSEGLSQMFREKVAGLRK